MSMRKLTERTWVANWVEKGGERIATYGTCNLCNRMYEIKGNGTLRKHGGGDCFLKPQLPAEMWSAILQIASLND